MIMERAIVLIWKLFGVTGPLGLLSGCELAAFKIHSNNAKSPNALK